MSGRANHRRATDDCATVRSGYCPIGLLSCRVTVSRAIILRAALRRANVLSGYCLSRMCPQGSVLRDSVRSGYCLRILKTINYFREIFHRKCLAGF